MARPKPLGFDNWRTFSFILNDGSGQTFYRKASFSIEEGGNHKLFVGPSIVSVNAAEEALVTTDEPHGFQVGQLVRLHGLPDQASTLNAVHVIAEVPSETSFKIPVTTIIVEEGTLASGSFVPGTAYTVAVEGTAMPGLFVGDVFVADSAGVGTGSVYKGMTCANIGIAGVDIEARIPVLNYACVPGDLCINEHPEAWETPLVG